MEELDVKKRLVPIVERLSKINEEQERLEEALAAAKRERDRILNDDIVCLLAEYGLSSCELIDGSNVGTEVVYETSQKDKDAALLASWLNSNGYSDAMKDILTLGKGEYDEDLESFLSENGYSFTRDSSIHSQTLKKILKDHIVAGKEPPPKEAVELKVFTRGFVKPPKKGKEF